MTVDKNSTITILGLSNNVERYSYLAYIKLLENGYNDLVGVTPKNIVLPNIEIVELLSHIEKPIHTLTVYLGIKKLESLTDEIIKLNPQRIILNPGTENQELIKRAKDVKIEVIIGCTLVMLNTNQF